MALSFTAGHLTLAAWGFSAGDIAVLAGAGRAVGNWVMNHLKDQALLQFLKVDPEDLIPRKGLIDPAALHQRWDVQLTLLQNGNSRVIGGKGGAVVESMGIFSWLMTIVVSGLDASLQVGDMRKVMSSFLTALFEEQVDGLDYLQRELPQHIQGWVSAAVVRNITRRARQEWATLLERKLRLPGMMPSEEKDEVVRFLIWLVGARKQKENRRFETASSDVFCLAFVLESLGLDLLRGVAIEKEELESCESSLLVVFNPAALGVGHAQNKLLAASGNMLYAKSRNCMRIPLDFKEECVSLWPGTILENNDRRQIFKDGDRACKSLEIFPVFPGDERHDFGYGFVDPTSAKVGRVDPAIYRVASSLFPVVNPSLVNAVSHIMAQFPEWKIVEDQSIFQYLHSNPACLSKIQVLFLGYYYALLDKVIDNSRLTTREGYGTWRWFDLHMLYELQDVLADNVREIAKQKDSHGNTMRYIKREGIMKFLAVLLAGAEENQTSAINESTIGIHGKISIVSSSLLAAGDTVDLAMKFCLLDTDSSAIPSNARGLVLSGEGTFLVRFAAQPSDDNLKNVSEVNQQELDQDFTSHIEPDWDNDVQACQVVFRYKGRVVRRLSPLSIERALVSPAKVIEGNPKAGTVLDKVLVGSVEGCFSTFPARNLDSPDHHLHSPPVLLPFKGRIKARACMRTVYHISHFRCIKLLELCASPHWAEITKGSSDQGEMVVLYREGNKPPEEEAWETARWVIIM
ncbi:hypothetical protein BU26DRAFT_557591 [Trematosphaeria pertusa]|uniref:Heterokaryon incompatibility domain-containing protein n=1 Tax=Trematosphaeria pertusa TaxID=390896 RepID=A0A6A6J0G7_9PLEO|nr:uncharacterized protein BU26DRAFT_557591 [Trematosphaeria pertusa]KAF2256116.1 hypothetical protein BU26DRAFT_557591 [Trematosphaeria pertusa]